MIYDMIQSPRNPQLLRLYGVILTWLCVEVFNMLVVVVVAGVGYLPAPVVHLNNRQANYN